ncbi:MAG: aldose 1-epimerase family protein [Candidatus Bathyarchaeia archaeon]
MSGRAKLSKLCRKFFEKTLTDVEKGLYIEKWKISTEELGLCDECGIEKCRLYGGLSDCVDVVEVDNGRLSFTVVPTRGMGIWKGSFEGVPLGWNSPVKSLVHPSFVNLEARGGLGWLDGFNEWIVRCGIENFGAPGPDVITDNMGNKKEVMLTLHGKIANIPASIVKARIGLEEPYELGVTGVVHERSMFGSNFRMDTEITTTPKGNSIKIVDTIRNLRSVPDEMQILYHCNYGSPFLEEDSRLVAPIQEVVPRDPRAAEGIKEFELFGPPEAGFVEQVFFFRLKGDEEGRTLVMLVNSDETKAVSISFSVKQLPCFTLWKNTNSLGEGYVVGLEPGTSYPNTRAFEREHNRVVQLQPGENYRSEINLSVHLGSDDVQRVKERIDEIGKGIEPKIFDKPVKEFSPY